MTFGLCLACGKENVLLGESGWKCLDCHDREEEKRILKKWASDMAQETGFLIIPSLKDFKEEVYK